MSRLPTPPLPGMKTIAPTNRRNAACWTPEELAFIDTVMKAWNETFANLTGGYRVSANVYSNRGLAKQLFRTGAFTADEVARAIRAYATDPKNKSLNGGDGSWKRFADWLSRGSAEENIDHQLRRIGYQRVAPLTPEQRAAQLAEKDAKAGRKRARLVALELRQKSPWPGYCRRARAASKTVRAIVEAELQNVTSRGSIATSRRAADYERHAAAAIAGLLQRFAAWEALPSDRREDWLAIGKAHCLALQDESSDILFDSAEAEGLAIEVFLRQLKKEPPK